MDSRKAFLATPIQTKLRMTFQICIALEARSLLKAKRDCFAHKRVSLLQIRVWRISTRIGQFQLFNVFFQFKLNFKILVTSLKGISSRLLTR